MDEPNTHAYYSIMQDPVVFKNAKTLLFSFKVCSRPAADLVRNLTARIAFNDGCLFTAAVGASTGSKIIVFPYQVGAKL